MYWLLNTKHQTPYICGSIVALSKLTGIPEDTLYGQFSREKNTEYLRDNWRIVKVDVIKSKR